MTKRIAQHWHIYQPRANDYWTDIINDECYKPNSMNGVFKHVSFNLGPTLIEWFEKNDKETLDRIISKDEGQALAQGFNHRILPLIRYPEDLETQVYWGKEHFKKYFKREPKGLWLPETATNKDVCRELFRQGIEFTIGAPWQNSSGKPGVYKVDLGDNQEITYFFYDSLSGKIAFNAPLAPYERFLDNADHAAENLVNQRDDFMLLAFDGETFGHHHKFADLWARHFPKAVNAHEDSEMITIDKYLEEKPELPHTSIRENTSWSCMHGLDRWKNGCSCSSTDYQPVLTECLENLEDSVHDIFNSEGRKFFSDTWEARNEYIHVKLGNMSEEDFFRKYLKQDKGAEKAKALLEAEFHLQLSFTSCGWFFSQISPPTHENIKDARRVVKLTEEATGKNLYEKIKKLEELRT